MVPSERIAHMLTLTDSVRLVESTGLMAPIKQEGIAGVVPIPPLATASQPPWPCLTQELPVGSPPLPQCPCQPGWCGQLPQPRLQDGGGRLALKS